MVFAIGLSKLISLLHACKTPGTTFGWCNTVISYLRAAAPAADPGQKKRFVCLRDDTKTKEFAQVRSSFAVTRRCLLLPFASDIFWCNPQSSQVRWMDACVGDILWSFAWDIAFAASKMFIHFKHQLSTRGMPGSVFIQCGSQDIRI